LEEIKEIFEYIPQNRQTLLFSATMPEPIKELANHILYNPEFISVVSENDSTTNNIIEQRYYMINESQRDEAIADDLTEKIMIEASYIHPDIVSKSVMGKKCEKDALFYRSSRGSESDLAFGLDYLASKMGWGKLPFVATKQRPKFSHDVAVTFSKINNFIGQEISEEKVISILEKLRFKLTLEGDKLTVLVPTFRHDIQNAQDATEESGSITVRLRTQGEFAIIEVEDTGMGMDYAFIHDKLFQPFESTKGTMGIGVFQVREYIHKLGGHLDVESVLGQGSTFSLFIPLSSSQEITNNPQIVHLNEHEKRK